jgi:hypothetical protein
MEISQFRIGTNLENVRKDMVLHISIVHSNGAAADLDPVENQVVMLPPNLVTRNDEMNAVF